MVPAGTVIGRMLLQQIGRLMTASSGFGGSQATQQALQKVAASVPGAINMIEQSSRLGRAAVSVGQRVGARNARRFLFEDMLSGGLTWELFADAEERAGDTLDTTAWIMGRMIGGALVKSAGQVIWNNTGMRQAVMGSHPIRRAQQARIAARAAGGNRTARLTKEWEAIQDGVNTRTGEIGGAPSSLMEVLKGGAAQSFDRDYFVDKLYQSSIWGQVALANPQTVGQKVAKGFGTGFVRQTAGTILFREMIDKPGFAKAAWATQPVHDLDEVWIPPTDAKTAYSRSEFFVQVLNAGTAFEGNYGLQRPNRVDMIKGINTQRKLKHNPLSYVNSLFQPMGYGKVAGALAAREVQQAMGEEEKRREAYKSRYYKERAKERQQHTRPKQSAQPRKGPRKVWITQHTRKDGTVVKGHWRTVG